MGQSVIFVLLISEHFEMFHVNKKYGTLSFQCCCDKNDKRMNEMVIWSLPMMNRDVIAARAGMYSCTLNVFSFFANICTRLHPSVTSSAVIAAKGVAFVMDHQTSGLHSQSRQSGFRWYSFAYQGLTEIPYDAILSQTDTLQVLDLSYNQLEEYPFCSAAAAANTQTLRGWNHLSEALL